MTYDKDRQQWVKAKGSKKGQYGSFLEPPSNITSDDDPFREISDLPVDEREEEDEERRREGEEQEGIDRDIFMGDPRSRPFRDEEEEIATVTGSGGSWVESEGFRGLTSTERPGREGRPGLSMGRVDSVRSFGSETTAVSGLERASGLGQAQTVRSMLDI